MSKALAEQAVEQGKGILRLSPTWVPRSFCVPGRRIKLHPDDYYVLGGARGGIDERWFSSTHSGPKWPTHRQERRVEWSCGAERLERRANHY